MPTTLIVADSLTTATTGSPWITLDDELVRAWEGMSPESMLGAVRLIGTHAAFNRLQIPRLLREIRNFAEATPALAGQAQAVAEFLSANASAGDGRDVYAIFLAD